MKTSPTSVTGTNDTAWSTMAAATATSFGAPKNVITAN